MTTLEQAAKKHNITLDQARELKSAMYTAWNYIGCEYIETFEGGEYEAIKVHGSVAAMIVELTVDAGRLLNHGDVDWFYRLDADQLKIAEDVYIAQG